MSDVPYSIVLRGLLRVWRVESLPVPLSLISVKLALPSTLAHLPKRDSRVVNDSTFSTTISSRINLSPGESRIGQVRYCSRTGIVGVDGAKHLPELYILHFA